MSHSELPPPTCLATILCEKVLEDVRTRNKTLVDCFNHINARDLPFRFMRCAIVVAVTSIHAKTPAKMTVTTPSNRTLLELNGAFEARSPNDVVEIVFDLRDIEFSEAGEHLITIKAGDAIIGSRRFQVTVVPPPEPT